MELRIPQKLQFFHLLFRSDWAVFGKGPYRLRKEFERYPVDDFQWGQLTAQQRLRKVDGFKKATMNDKEEFAEEYAS